ncbi:MAG: hypothetical protein ACRDNK_09195 [Solirubrobacteraceae bacterium]
MKRPASLIAALSVVAGASVFALSGAIAGASSASATGALPTIALAMDGKSITVTGTPQSGAVTIASTTTGEPQGQPMLVRLNPGASFGQAFGAVGAHRGDPNYFDPYGAIVFDTSAPKGTSSAQTSLQPGSYVALDTVGNNPARWPHASFTVTQAAAPASLPAAQASVKAIEFGFRGPGALHNGQVVRVQNDGFLVHMVDGIGVKNAAAAGKLTALLRAGKDKQAQRLATGFVSFAGPVSQGAMQQQVLHAKPGMYVLVCFMDTQDGREHTRLGMERTIRILK